MIFHPGIFFFLEQTCNRAAYPILQKETSFLSKISSGIYTMGINFNMVLVFVQMMKHKPPRISEPTAVHVKHQ